MGTAGQGTFREPDLLQHRLGELAVDRLTGVGGAGQSERPLVEMPPVCAPSLTRAMDWNGLAAERQNVTRVGSPAEATRRPLASTAAAETR